MSLELSVLVELTQALTQTESLAEREGFSTTFLQHCQQIASLTKVASKQSEPFYALLVLRVHCLSDKAQHALNYLVATQLLCQRMSVNEHTAHTLLSAAVCSVFCPVQQHQALLDWLKQRNHSLWYSSLIALTRILPHMHKRRVQSALSRLQALQRLMLLAALLSDNKSHPNGLRGQLQYWAPKLPPSFVPLLDSLFPFPGLLPPGTAVRLPDKTSALILSLTADGYLVRHISSPAQLKTVPVWQLHQEEVQEVLATQVVENIEELGLRWDAQWHNMQSQTEAISACSKSSYPIAQPPAKLIVIQDLLGHAEPDLDKLARHIADEGFLAHQLNEDASRRARLKLQFVEVKHALLFQGLARTRHLLIQQALLSRVNQHYFPLQESLLQMTQVLVNSMEVLANQNGTAEHGEVKTLGYFACAGLFTNTWLKGRVKLPQSASPNYSLTGLLAVPQADELIKHAIALAQGWKQDSQLIQALRYHASPAPQIPRPARRLGCLLGLGLLMTRQIWFGESETTEMDYYQEAMAYLRLSPARWQYLKWQTVEVTHCYCPR
ncbi:hypothetical protein [Bowmanella yangjiangensis]|uniref:HDOD domain-containing protein n=1 Tax=Bowmanella yangjiangensis TaxID=2811230 RepID=A0ABS3D0K1_9ALTE|nr:hypothetical protein [Bowmanella yangjiangensis]MBN7821409.1 hypothetical protein [Bowmanella yangjiangensis]